MTEPEQAPEQPELRNTLYRRLTRGQRKLTPARMFVYRVAVVVGLNVVRLAWRSCRLQPMLGLDAAREVVRESKAVLPVYWHRHLLFGVRGLLELREAGLKLGFLISPSVDGTAPAMLVQRVGAHVIRGSSSHTGARALRDYYETIVKQQISPAIAPDGPRGPINVCKPGAVLLSQMTGKPILPVTFAASRTWRLKTWDRFEIPLPFSRVVIAFGEPLRVPRATDAAAQSRLLEDLARRLDDLNGAARAALKR